MLSPTITACEICGVDYVATEENPHICKACVRVAEMQKAGTYSADEMRIARVYAVFEMAEEMLNLPCASAEDRDATGAR